MAEPVPRARPRLVVNCAANALDVFEQVAAAAATLAGEYEVRLVVSHLAHMDTRELHDPGDPYLRYSINFPSLFGFAVPEALAPGADRASVKANVALLGRKI